MSNAASLLPSSATKFERNLSVSTDSLPRVGPAAELIRSAKRNDIPDSVVPWLIVEYGLGELLPYLSDPRTAIATGVLWQRLRGTPESFKIALGWIGNDGQIEESEASTIRWSQFQLGLAQAPVDLSQTDSIVEIGRLSSPVRSKLFRIYGGWYDGRRFNLDDHQLSGLDTLCDHTGVYLKEEWPQLSFGREFKNDEGDISGDLSSELGVHRASGISGLYEDRTFLSNSILGETPWRTLHIEDLSSVISRLHFSVYGPWWNNATSWDVDLSYDQIFDWAGLTNALTPALKFAKAGMYLSDYAELGDTNACLPARFLEEFGDGVYQLSEGNLDTGEGILSEHLSRVEFTEINERFEQQTELGSMWVGGGNNQVQVETHQLQHGQAYASTSHPNPPEHATLITSLSHYNGTRNNRLNTSETVFGDGAGHTLGQGEDFTSLGLTSFEDGDGGSGYPEYFDLGTLVIDEAAGTISAVDSNGTTHTRPLLNQDGVRRVTEFRNVYAPDNTGQIWIGAKITLLPTLREHTRELSYDDSFELSRSRLSEFTPLHNEQAISRSHTTSAIFPQPSSAWDDTGLTWNETLDWANLSQPEQILRFSLAGVCLSETGFLSDSDGELGDTQATLGFFEAERIERSHQTMAPLHPYGFGQGWEPLARLGNGDIAWVEVSSIQIIEPTAQIPQGEIRGTVQHRASDQWWRDLFDFVVPLYSANGDRRELRYENQHHEISYPTGIGTYEVAHVLFENPSLTSLKREHQRVLAYDDSFELSRTRLSEFTPLVNEQSITREHNGELTYAAGPFTTNVLNFHITHLYLSDTDDGLGGTNATLGWNVSQRFDRDYFAQATENRQSFTVRLHTRTVQTEASFFPEEPTWSQESWAGPIEQQWATGAGVWQNNAWPSTDWNDGADLTWANEPMWARIARWQMASLVVESQHQTHV